MNSEALKELHAEVIAEAKKYAITKLIQADGSFADAAPRMAMDVAMMSLWLRDTGALPDYLEFLAEVCFDADAAK